MFDHVGIVFRDLKAARAFYTIVLEQIGIRLMEDHRSPTVPGGSFILTAPAKRLSSWWPPGGLRSGMSQARRLEAPHTSHFARTRARRSIDFTRWAFRTARPTTARQEFAEAVTIARF